MRRRTFLASLVGTAPLAVSACCLGPPLRSPLLAESALTYRQFRQTLAFRPADGLEAFAPLPVHPFDVDLARAGGAALKIDGAQWLGLDYAARNDALLELQPKAAWNGTLIQQVASADIWWVPFGSRDLFTSRKIEAWNWTELGKLSGYRDVADYGRTQLTRVRYDDLTAYAPPPAGQDLAPITFVHDVGPIGWQAICEANAWTGFVLGHDWVNASPEQRTGQLFNAQNYLKSMTVFQGAGLDLTYAVAIPQGRVYPVAGIAWDGLRAGLALKDWTVAELAGMPQTVTTEDQDDRPIRSEFIRAVIRFEP